MSGRTSRDKGARAERELAALIADHLGYPVKRRHNIGTHEDIGDLLGVPRTVIQVANWSDVSAAALVKPREVEQQRENAGADFACSFVRFRGGQYRVVLTVEQWAELMREALA